MDDEDVTADTEGEESGFVSKGMGGTEFGEAPAEAEGLLMIVHCDADAKSEGRVEEFGKPRWETCEIAAFCHWKSSFLLGSR